jgi:hypothetical protein
VSQSTRVRVLAGAAAAVTLPVAILTGWNGAPWWAPVLLAVGVMVSEIAVVHLAFGRQGWTFSLTEGAIAAAYVLRPGAWAVIAVVLGATIALRFRRQPALKLQFNVAQLAAGTALGAWLAAYLGGGVEGAAAGMGVFFLVNNGLVAGAVAVMTSQRTLAILWDSAPIGAIHSTATSSLGVLAAWLAMHQPLGLVGVVSPIFVLWLSYDEQTARAAEARLFAELARGQEEATGRSIDTSAQVVITAAARLFGGADVEMVLLAEDGAVRYAGDEFGVRHRRSVDLNAFDEPWVHRVLGSRGVRTGLDDDRPYCSALIGEPDNPLAAIIARRPAGAAGFGRREIMLAGVLVAQAESWLSVAELAAARDDAVDRAAAADQAARALGDLGAHTTPALVVLRESAGRLARLATSPGGDDPVGDIVHELHAVERAVASLLGAIALAAEPEIGRTAADIAEPATAAPAPARGVTDWTTTGVLVDAEMSS